MKPLSKNTSTLLFIILTGVLVVVAFISYNKILQYNKSVEEMMHINKIKGKIVEVLSNLKDAEIQQRGYLLTGDSVFLNSIEEHDKNNSRRFKRTHPHYRRRYGHHDTTAQT